MTRWLTKRLALLLAAVVGSVLASLLGVHLLSRLVVFEFHPSVVAALSGAVSAALMASYLRRERAGAPPAP